MAMIVSPNQLTVLRMAFVPVFVILIVYQHTGLALAVFFLAGITDMLDGLVARKFGQRTHLGTFLDPMADKLLLVSSFTILSMGSLELAVRIPLWLTITVIGRDLLLVVSVLTIYITVGRRTFLPTLLGKWTTACQVFLIILVLLGNYLDFQLRGSTMLMYLTLALTVVSGLHYMVRGMKLIEQETAGPL
jgi:cardiolipin synthase